MKRLFHASLTLVAASLLGFVILSPRHAAPRPALADPQAPRFEAVDVFIDTGGEALAAYQIDLSASAGRVQIVGIEGGDAAAFSQPPSYDPAAMQHERVILGAYSTLPREQLPTGRVRIARVHVMVEGSEPAEYKAKVMTAGGMDARKIDATVNVMKVEGDRK